MNKRILWVDVAKFFGIFSIYVGHFGEIAGKSQHFTGAYQVPLFFLISGCVENLSHERSIGKRVKQILLPFWLFAFLSIFIQALLTDAELSEIKHMLVLTAKGAVRNSFVAPALWFLTCLFVVEIIFMFIRLLKNRVAILAASFFLFWIAECVIEPRPIVSPHWFYNIDSAFYYTVFYAIGFLAFSVIREIFGLDTKLKKRIFVIGGISTCIYSALLFEGKNVLDFMHRIPVFRYLHPVFTALLVIWFIFTVSRLCEDINALHDMGRNTLYLCGSEYIVKVIVTCLIGLVGLKLRLESPLSVYLYTGIVLITANKFFVPLEKEFLRRIRSVIEKGEN